MGHICISTGKKCSECGNLKYDEDRMEMACFARPNKWGEVAFVKKSDKGRN